MFHVHTAGGVRFNVPLEQIQRAQKAPPPRRRIGLEYDTDQAGPAPRFSDAEKAYIDGLHADHERREIYYAYEIMSSPVHTLRQDLKITDAWEYFAAKGVHHMPVLSDIDEMIGMVSDGDLLKRLIIIDNTIENVTDVKVKDVITREVISAGRVTDIRRIAKAMFDNHVGTMPILDEKVLLAGIITRSDILYALINSPPLKIWA